MSDKNKEDSIIVYMQMERLIIHNFRRIGMEVCVKS